MRFHLSLVFIAIATALATASPAAAQATAPALAAKAAELPPDLAFGRAIALIRGHLLAGDELVKRRDWSEAAPHFSYPTEEIYGVIRDDLHNYRTPQFDGALHALVRAVKTRKIREYPAALEKVDRALAVADAGLKAKVPNWPRFQMAVAVELLKAAADEYEEAVDNGRVRAIGYRTARGFIFQADRMIEVAAPQVGSANPTAMSELRAALAQLKGAFARIDTPPRLTIDVAEVGALVARGETAEKAVTGSGS